MPNRKSEGEKNEGAEAKEKKTHDAIQLIKRSTWFLFLSFIKNIRRFKTLIEVAALGGAVFYAIVTYNQWQDSNHNFTVDERAWVGIMEVRADGGNETHDTYTAGPVWLTVRNTGKTPALNVSIETGVGADFNLNWREPFPDFDIVTRKIDAEREKSKREVDERNLANTPPEMRDELRARIKKQDAELAALETAATEKMVGHGVMAPGVTQTYQLVGREFSWPRRDKRDDALRNYILGKITYTDIFDAKKVHTTTICLWHDTGMQFAICPNGKMD
jgi:hypothetical protein